MDNLNTRADGSLRQAFAPERTRRLRERPEIHYTPQHGGCLDTWPISSYRCSWPASAWSAGSPRRRNRESKSPPGRRATIAPRQRSIGGSPPTSPALSSASSTRQPIPDTAKNWIGYDGVGPLRAGIATQSFAASRAANARDGARVEPRSFSRPPARGREGSADGAPCRLRLPRAGR